MLVRFRPRLLATVASVLAWIPVIACSGGDAADSAPADALSSFEDTSRTFRDSAGTASGPSGSGVWVRLATGVAPEREAAALRLPDGSLAVAWVAGREGSQDLHLLRVAPDGSPHGRGLTVVSSWAALGSPVLVLLPDGIRVVFAGSETEPGGPQLLHVAAGTFERGFGPPRALGGPPADGRPDAVVGAGDEPVVVFPSGGRVVVRGFGDADVAHVLDAPCCPEHVAVAYSPDTVVPEFVAPLEMAWSSRDPGAPGLFRRSLGNEVEPNVEVPYSVLPGGIVESPTQRVALAIQRSPERVVIAYCSVPDCEAVYLWIGFWRLEPTEPVEVALVPGATNVAISAAREGVWVAWLREAAVHAVPVRASVGTLQPDVEASIGPILMAPFDADTGEPVYLAVDGSYGPLDVVLVTRRDGAGMLWHRRLADDVPSPFSPGTPGGF
jgi:hypothetical protein